MKKVEKIAQTHILFIQLAGNTILPGPYPSPITHMYNLYDRLHEENDEDDDEDDDDEDDEEEEEGEEESTVCQFSLLSVVVQ